MSQELKKTESGLVAKADFNSLMGKLYHLDKALLLDTSYSMTSVVESLDGQPVRAIDNLRTLAEEFRHLRKFSFNSTITEIGGWVPEPSGGTDLAKAFRYVKEQGCKQVVLITDGQPDSPEDALYEARGLHVDIYYIGPQPCPDFVHQLALQCGGTVGQSDLTSENIKQIGQTIAGYLEGGTDESKICL